MITPENLWGWRDAGGILQFTMDGTTWLDHGRTAEALEAVAIWDFLSWNVRKDGEDVNVLRAYPRGNAEAAFYWMETKSPFDQTAERDTCRSASSAGAGLHYLALLAGATGLRLDPQRGWRPLVCNPVLHFQFGISLAAATDGAQVLLLDHAQMTSRWFLAHRGNCEGDVTASPTAVTSVAGKVAKSPEQKAVELLERLLKGMKP